jgi:hypothetical protein
LDNQREAVAKTYPAITPSGTDAWRYDIHVACIDEGAWLSVQRGEYMQITTWVKPTKPLKRTSRDAEPAGVNAKSNMQMLFSIKE